MIGIGDNMKKIVNDKSFWTIFVISIVTLVCLVVGVVFLTRQNTKEFYSAGYIINSTATKSDKYYFSEETIYKENVFNEYVFKDVDDQEVSTSKENFIHYLDNSLSFMKNGVILDLDNFNENIVPYYNITDKSIIQHNNGGYYVETADKTLVFGNFLGRITDNKYIVVGKDIGVKLSGNDDVVKADYFEILFVEDGIVKIENQESSYQTISEGTIIYIGNNFKIDLGDKSLNYGDETKLNLTELTINGNENIDIVPEQGLVNDKGDTNENGGSGNGTGDGNGTGEGNGDGTNVEGETTTVLKKEIAVNLIDASTTVNSINAKFQVIDTMEAIKGNLVLTIVNTTTGKTVYTKLLAKTPEEQSIFVTSDIDSDCNYVMTIVDETNETSTQYFQKSFRTDSLNLRLKRELVTETSLSYSLDFGTQSDVAKADISIYDQDGNEIGRKTVDNGASDVVTFDELTHHTLYNVKVDRVFIKNVLEERYFSNTSDWTLKNKPVLGNVSAKTNNDAKVFTLSMDSVTDEDDAIVKYTYQIYEGVNADNIDTIEPVYTFVRSELNDETLKIGKINESVELKGNTNYWFKIVAQYYDNYRYNEVKTGFSSSFNVIGVPTLSFEADVIEINRIAGTVMINDEGCTVPFKGRECYDKPNNFIIRYTGGKDEDKLIENVIVDSNNQTLYFDITGLDAGTDYFFTVFADVDLKNGEDIINGYPLGTFSVRTADIDALKVINWEDNEFSKENPISINAEIISKNPYNESINKLSYITFNLYEGPVKNYSDRGKPIATVTMSENVFEKYYNKKFTIDFDMFEYDETLVSEDSVTNFDILKDLSGDELSEYYTIEITELWDDTHDNKYDILDNVWEYKIPAIVLVEDQVTPPTIKVEPITNKMTESGEFSDYGIEKNIAYSSVGQDVVRGYRVIAQFEKQKIASYFKGNPITKINFYAHDINGNVIEQKTIDFIDTEEYITYFFLGDGTDYNVDDNANKELRRGNVYTFSYDLSINDDNIPSTEDILYPTVTKPTSEPMEAEKQTPVIKYYIDNSTDSSVTYKYQVFDYDNALCKEDDKYYIYYSVNDSEDYKTEYVKDGSSDVFTLSNLVNQSIYGISYYSAIIKNYEPNKSTIKNYYFDGYYNLDGELKYSLDYSDDSNYLNIIIEDNEFMNRVSSYLLTLTATGVDKTYQKVISDLSDCDGKQCIILNYTNLKVKDGDNEISFKGKDISVGLTAFYDTGFVGFGQESKLGNYFMNLNLVSEEDASKVGFVYQTVGTTMPGKYFYVRHGNFVDENGFIGLYDSPKGILGFELLPDKSFNKEWHINSSNLIDNSTNSFVSFGQIYFNNAPIKIISEDLGGFELTGNSVKFSTPVTINPKVLDKIDVSPAFEDSFKFTSIIPNVSSTVSERLINGGTMDITLDVDEDLLKSDYCATDDNNSDSDVCGNTGKYKIYIDIYQKGTCPEANLTTDGECTPVKKVETDAANLNGVSFVGLLPNTSYTYNISADMNKNGKKVKTLLFDKDGDVFEGEFNTLNKEEILYKKNGSQGVKYSHSSSITETSYSTRKINFATELKTKTNFNIVYELFDINGNLEFEDKITISNEEIVQNGDKFVASYVHDVTGNDFVFGAGYHELVITAVTTDLEAPLELYRGKLDYNPPHYGFRKLDSIANGGKFDEFNIGLSHSAGINDITSTIIIKDVDKVINDGTFYVRLQDTNENNLLVCSDKSDTGCVQACSAKYGADEEREALENACRLQIKLSMNEQGQILGICENASKYSNIESCKVIPSGDSYITTVKFKDLLPDNFYSIFVHADTYSKNYDNGKFIEPVGVATARKNQYTKSDLGFSLGSVTPTYSLSDNKLRISYVDAANLTNSLYGIEYTITERGGSKIMNGSLGDTIVGSAVTNSKLSFNGSSNPTIEISLGNKTLTTSATYYVTITYYYKDTNGKLALLTFGDKTNDIYTIEIG